MTTEQKTIFNENDEDWLCPECGAYWQCTHTMPEMVLCVRNGAIDVQETGRFVHHVPVPKPPLGLCWIWNEKSQRWFRHLPGGKMEMTATLGRLGDAP